MARAKKLQYSRVKLGYDEEENIVLRELDLETGEVVNCIDLIEDVKLFTSELTDVDFVDITVKQYKEKVEKPKEPIYKFGCSCGNEIKSKNEELNITCNECNTTFDLI